MTLGYIFAPFDDSDDFACALLRDEFRACTLKKIFGLLFARQLTQRKCSLLLAGYMTSKSEGNLVAVVGGDGYFLWTSY